MIFKSQYSKELINSSLMQHILSEPVFKSKMPENRTTNVIHASLKCKEFASIRLFWGNVFNTTLMKLPN